MSGGEWDVYSDAFQELWEQSVLLPDAVTLTSSRRTGRYLDVDVEVSGVPLSVRVLLPTSEELTQYGSVYADGADFGGDDEYEHWLRFELLIPLIEEIETGAAVRIVPDEDGIRRLVLPSAEV